MIFNNREYNIKVWDGENLGSNLAIDTETTMVPFTQTPDLITFQAYNGGDNVYYVPRHLIKLFLGKHYYSNLIFINAPFDTDVIAKSVGGNIEIFDYYDANRIFDIGVLYRLLHLAVEGYVPFKHNLKFLSEKFLNVNIEKDERRENFSQFKECTIGDIPQEYLEYGAIDVICTFNLFFTLKGLIQPYDRYNTLLSHHIQVKGDYALNGIYKNGIGFDLLQRDNWLIGVDREMERNADILASWGWVRGKKGIKDDYERIMKALSLYDKLPKTEDGHLSSKSDDLEPYKNSSQFVKAYLDYQTLEKASSFVRDITSSTVNPRYNLMVNTGRSSASKPNIQQLPRLGGIREMFIPKNRNNVFIITDYSAIELATLAQTTYTLYGESVMRDRINEGEDLHKYYASVMHNCPISEVTKEWRQEAKACFSGDTEMLTKDGWVRIDSIDRSVDIMQYNPHTKELSFTKPFGYVEFKDKELLHITNDYTDCMVTPDHRMLRISRSGHVEETLAENIENNEQYSFVHGGFYKDSSSKNNSLLTRLAVLIQADGSFYNKDGVKFGFSKDRKINRFKQLMEEAGISYTTYIKDSVTSFRINMGPELQSLLTANKEFVHPANYCAESFIDELWRWDGSTYGKHGKVYFNTSLRSIEVAQEILITNGYKSSIQTHVDKDVTHKDCYRLHWYVGDRKKNPQYGRLSGVSSVKAEGLHKVYCPSVPTSWVLTRRNGKVSVQGNCNFGFPGGLGPDTFIEFSRGYGLELTRKQAEHMKEIWFEAFPEMREYMKNEQGFVYTLTGRRRGRTSYCAEKNTPFQGLAADGAKLALYNLRKAGLKTVLFCHDEIVCEVPRNKAEEMLKKQEEIMISSMKIVTPEVDVRVESQISPFYTK